jgi:hypothetical protein
MTLNKIILILLIAGCKDYKFDYKCSNKMETMKTGKDGTVYHYDAAGNLIKCGKDFLDYEAKRNRNL